MEDYHQMPREPIFDSRRATASPRHVAVDGHYETLYNLIDFLAAAAFVVGSTLFFFPDRQNSVIRTFLVGSILFAARPTVQLLREFHLARIPLPTARRNQEAGDTSQANDGSGPTARSVHCGYGARGRWPWGSDPGTRVLPGMPTFTVARVMWAVPAALDGPTGIRRGRPPAQERRRQARAPHNPHHWAQIGPAGGRK
jgi:hypothetical protein